MLAIVLVLAVVVGVALGLFGGGGSTLTVPVLTYLAGESMQQAITSSLLIVAVSSAVGLLAHARMGRVDWRVGLAFGAAAMAGAYVGGKLSGFVPARVLMILFAMMMVAAAVSMFRRDRSRSVGSRPLDARMQGVVVGAMSGLVGAGGGFLVVPALVSFGRLTVERAIATSLLVICMQSLAGFVGHLGHIELDWPLTLAMAAVAVAGSVAGVTLVRRFAPASLRRGFGWFLLVIAVLVLVREVSLA